MIDDVLRASSQELPPFNDRLIKQYRKNQIDGCIEFMKMIFIEATRLFDGKVQFRRAKILSPEERLQIANENRYAITVDIAPSELMLVEFELEYEGAIFKVPLYLPYLKEDAIISNGSKYYIQFALTDRVFYHIPKDNGLGIKVLRAHLQFWRNLRHQFTSMSGQKYGDQVIITKIFLKARKYTAEDIKTALLLYPLSQFGFYKTLERYGIDRKEIEFVGYYNKEDATCEYFQIRKPQDSGSGVYRKVKKELLETISDTESKTKMRVVTALHYVLQYFQRFKETTYTDNDQLIEYLTNEGDTTVWKIILGKTIYGLRYSTEPQVCSFAIQHLDSLKTYLDPHTKFKLEEENVYVKDIMDLLDYIFVNMDAHVVNYTPSDLTKKRINILDLLFGKVVQSLFTKVYDFTNDNKKNRECTLREIQNLFRIPIRSFCKLANCGAVVVINPPVYHDNYLITVGARKMRATQSATGNSRGGGKTKQQNNHLTSPEHRFHPSWMVVESCHTVSNTNPDISGDINVAACDIDERGNIVISETAEQFIQRMMSFVVTR